MFRKGTDGKLHARPVYQTDIIGETSLKKWLTARADRTLPELQLEALKWILVEEEKIDVAKPNDETNILVPLRAKISKLRKQVGTKC